MTIQVTDTLTGQELKSTEVQAALGSPLCCGEYTPDYSMPMPWTAAADDAAIFVFGESFDAAIAGFRADIAAAYERLTTLHGITAPHVKPAEHVEPIWAELPAPPVADQVYDQQKGWVPKPPFNREEALNAMTRRSRAKTVNEVREGLKRVGDEAAAKEAARRAADPDDTVRSTWLTRLLAWFGGARPDGGA